VKEIKRLAAGAVLSNDASGFINVNVVDFDGGEFGLHPRIDDTGVVLVDPNRPGGYGIRIAGDPAVLDRLGKALLTVSRNAKGQSDEDDD
jgi:hypothetical protein